MSLARAARLAQWAHLVVAIRVLPVATIPVLIYTRGIEGMNTITPVLGALVFVSGVVALIPAWRATLAAPAELAPVGRIVRITLAIWATVLLATQVTTSVLKSGNVPFAAIAGDVVSIAWVMFTGQLARAAGVTEGERLRRLAFAFIALHALVQLLPFQMLYQRGLSLAVISPLLGSISILAGVLPLVAAFNDARRVMAKTETEIVAQAVGDVGAGPEDPWRP